MKVAAVLACLAIGCLGSTQESQPDKPRHVGLVLGGGAQFGLAHIGVLKWLEEHRIPVHSVSGTSIGAIVGGLYSLGHSPQEIEDLVRTIDWEKAFGNDSSFEHLDLPRKRDKRDVPGAIELGPRKLPSSLTNAPELSLVLSRAALPYGENTKFDELPIPFRAVAFDYRRLRKYVPSGGSLPLAIRASASVSVALPPVATRNRMLGDGALVEVLPVATSVETFQPDVILAVNVLPVGTSSAHTEPIRHPRAGDPLRVPDVAQQTYLVSAALAAAQIDAAVALLRTYGANGFLLSPDVTREMRGWSDAEWFIQKGYESAQANAASLSAFALSEEDWQAHVALRAARRAPLPVEPDRAVAAVVGADKGHEAALAEAVGKVGLLDRPSLADPGEGLEDLEGRLRRLLGSGRYQTITYEMAPDRDEIVLHARLKDSYPSVITLAPSVGAETSLLGRFVVHDPLGFGSEGRVNFSVGNTYELTAELEQPLGGPFFSTIRAGVGKQDYLDRRLDGASIDFGYRPGNAAELRVGYGSGRAFGDHGWMTAVDADTTDRAMIPNRGVRLEGVWFIPAEGSYWEARGTAFVPVARGSLLLSGGAGRSTAFHPPLLFGPNPSDRNYAFGAVGFILPVSQNPLLFIPAGLRLGVWAQRSESADSEWTFGTGAFGETPVGPFFLGLIMSERKSIRLRLHVGRMF